MQMAVSLFFVAALLGVASGTCPPSLTSCASVCGVQGPERCVFTGVGVPLDVACECWSPMGFKTTAANLGGRLAPRPVVQPVMAQTIQCSSIFDASLCRRSGCTFCPKLNQCAPLGGCRELRASMRSTITPGAAVMGARAAVAAPPATTVTTVVPAPAKLGNDPSCLLGRCRTSLNCPNPRTENRQMFQEVCMDDGTERAWTGALLNSKGKGVYKCSCCGHELFHSDTKFDSKTGWPSYYSPFNDSSVTLHSDYKMGYERIEVRCAKCGAHLGHVFPDGPPPTGKRYCINSVCLDFQRDVPDFSGPGLPAATQPATAEDPAAALALFLKYHNEQQEQLAAAASASTATATVATAAGTSLAMPKARTPLAKAVVAGGCFWGIELVFEYVKGVVDARSGYSGGTAADAQYKTVTSGKTDHAEAVEVTFDPSIVSYRDLLRIFFAVHDPTTLNYQIPDYGRWYRSAVHYADPAQKVVAQEVMLEVQPLLPSPVVTELAALKKFYPAEEYHQDFARRNPQHGYIVRWDLEKLDILEAEFPQLFNASRPLPGFTY